MAKNNIIERAQRCSIYTSIFFGYVTGRRDTGDITSVNQMASDFIKHHGLEDIIDETVIQVSFINYNKIFRELKRDENRRK